jgi:hypothetical protein
MADFTIRNIPAKDYAELRRDAKQNRRSLNAQILSMIADRAEISRRRRASIPNIRLIRDYA